jgi:hypothetical protein
LRVHYGQLFVSILSALFNLISYLIEHVLFMLMLPRLDNLFVGFLHQLI